MSARLDRIAATRPRGATPSMSPRQTEAYLLARDTVRRIRRTASLLASASRPGATGLTWNLQQRH
ncbi:MAG: hypothetical protein EOO24_45060 [Comamonadaceae bacterium]|nr:MAG: hypothetical protein EOO24_45060 [Comamonadaceae bacterium]